MTQLLFKVLNMSYTASWLVLAVLLLRLVLKKAPRWIHVLLWAMVGLRLICPISLESVLSLIPSTEVVSPQIVYDSAPAIHTGISQVDTAVNPVISQTFAPDPAASANPLQPWLTGAGILWLLGMTAMLAYTAITYLRLRRQVADAVRLVDAVYQSGRIPSPFVLGLFRPRIYLPFGLPEAELFHVVAHERAHIARKDHWWKPLGFALLALHWFNPLMWTAYILLCRDIELACDEKVIRQLGTQQRADYSQALLSCSVSRRSIAACPLAFGEVGVKARIKSILRYKKPGFWILVVAIILCIAVGVCFLTDPAAKHEKLYEDTVLAVGIRNSDGSVMEEDAKWHYYAIRRGEKVTLPGSIPASFSIKNIYEDAIWLELDPMLQREDSLLQGLRLERDQQVELMAGGPGGSTEYSFLIMTQPSTPDQVFQWIGDAYDFREEQTIMFPHFPGVTFHYIRGGLWAEGGDGERWDIADGMPIQNVYFADLSGDGKPEVCASVSFGSGMIDTYVVAADYVTGERFFLRDRGICDYTLTEENGKLVCIVTDYQSGAELNRGRLLLADAGGGEGKALVLAEDAVKSEPTAQTRDMTLSDLYDLAQKGEGLAWKHLAPFRGSDVGSGLYIMKYPIGESYHLLVGDGKTEGTPMYARLVANSTGRFIDIRTEDLMPFLEEHKEDTLKAVAYMDALSKLKDEGADALLPTKADCIRALTGIVDTLHGNGGISIYLGAVHAYGISGGFVSDRGAIHLLNRTYASTAVSYADASDRGGYPKVCTPQAQRGALDTEIERLLEIIQSTPTAPSNSEAHIAVHEAEYQQLLSYGADTLQYCFTQFLSGDQTDLRGRIMALACEDIMLSWGEAYIVDLSQRLTGQDWFEAFRSMAGNLRARYGAEQLEDQYPGSWVFLQMVS